MINLNFTPFPVLTSNRLNLRQLRLNDEAEIFSIRSDAENLKYLDRPLCQSIEEAKAFINKINENIEKNECIYWAIAKKGNEKLIGTICYWNINKIKSTAEIGFELLPEFRGQGLMSEAVKKVIEFGFEKMKLSTIVGEVHYKNYRSINLLEKFNFSKRIHADESNTKNIKKKLTIIYQLINKG